MEFVIALLLKHPLLLLFVVAAVGYPLGRIPFRGVRLGAAAVLFSGLGIGALHPEMRLPEFVWQLGLVLFIYTMGLSCGPQFFAAFRRRGLLDNAFTTALILLAALGTCAAAWSLPQSGPLSVGLFCGALTNTPALAAALELFQDQGPEGAARATEAIVGYSIAYPFGVLGMMFAMLLVPRLFKIDIAADAARQHAETHGGNLVNRSILVTHPGVMGRTLEELDAQQHWKVTFGRCKRNGEVMLATGRLALQIGDIVTCVGTAQEVERVCDALGAPSAEKIELDRSHLDYRRVFVSEPSVAGQSLRDLDLPQQFGAVVTRVRRGDIDFVPDGGTTLELGDHIRILTRRENFQAVAKFFGDSYRAVSEVDILTLGLGIALGLLLGLVSFPLPGGLSFRLGLAGGPLLVALIAGYFNRTGPLVWSLPFGANQTLRQIGLVFFLAGVGTKAGYAFVSTLQKPEGLLVLGAGAVLTFATGFLTLVLGHVLLRHALSSLTGTLAGLQTNPAVLEFATTLCRSDVPAIHYVTVYPFCIVLKVILAQVLALLL